MNSDQVLEKALHILERDGWHQGGLTDYSHASHVIDSVNATEDDTRYMHWQTMRNAPVCSVGAMNRAIFGSASSIDLPASWVPVDINVAEEVFVRLREAIDGDDIPIWNDDESTTREDVILAFKRARHGTA